MPAPELVNLQAACPGRVLDPAGTGPASVEGLSAVLPPSLAEMELCTRPTIPIPPELQEIYGEFRPTPMRSADRFAAAVGNDTTVLVKDEGATPSGNHKMNSAYWIVYHCARDGVRTVTTETTGNWGIALALAGARFGVRTVCFLDSSSAAARPDRADRMRDAGAEVLVVGPDQRHSDPLKLSANGAVDWTRERPDARYIFGSVYNYFVLPQTMTGLEVRRDLADAPPDVVVGSCGGGANLLGVSGAYLLDALAGVAAPEVVCAESAFCPIVSKGVAGVYSIDDRNHYPHLATYGLDRLLGETYIGGLGSTIVAAPVAHFHEQGLLRTREFSVAEATEAAELYHRAEGRRVALETGYQLAAVVAEGRARRGRRILVSVSTVGAGSYA